MGHKGFLVIAVSALVLAGCAANYSQDATSFATGISDLKIANTTLSESRIQQIQTYYNVKRARHNAAPVATAACHDFDASQALPDDRRNCFLWDSEEPKDILREQRAAQASARSRGITLSPPPTPPVAATPTEVADLSPEQIRARLKSYNVPDVCIDYALSSGRAQVTSPGADESSDKEQQAYLQSFPTQQRVFMALESYSQGLAAITKQSDIDDYKASATKLATSVGTLATAAGTLAGGAGAVIAGPVAKAVTTLVTDIRLAALQRERYQALHSAVLAACIPIHTIGIGEQVFMSGEYSDVQRYNKMMIDSVMTANPQVRKANTDALMQAIAAFRSPATPPDRVISAFVEAHDKLMEDVLSGKGQTQDGLQEIDSFADDAKALKDALQTKLPKASGGS